MNSSKSDARVLSILRSYVIAASLISISVGLIVLIGWSLNIAPLKSILPNAATMKFNTALGFILAGVSLWFVREKSFNQEGKRIGQVLAGLVLIIGLLTLSEYLFQWNAGIDQLLVKDMATPANAHPGRMSEITAVGFILIGLAVMLIHSRTTQYLSFSVALLSYLAVVGYLYDFSSLYQLPGYGSIALHTAIGFFILSLGIIAADPSGPITNFLTTEASGSKMMRRSLPMLILLLMALGWLVQKGENLGIYDVTNDTVILIVLMVLAYTPLLYLNAMSMNRAERELKLKDDLLQMTSEMAKVGGWEYDVETHKGTWTDEVARIHGLDPKQVTNVELGLSFYQGESRQKIEKAVREANEDGTPYDLDLEMTTASGDHKWVRTMALPIMEDEKVVKVQGIFQDITRQKQDEEQIQRQLKRLNALRDIDIAISTSFNIHITLDIVLRQVRSQLNVDAVAILLYLPETQTLEYAGNLGFRSNAAQQMELKLGEGHASRVVLERQTIHLSDLNGIRGDSADTSEWTDENFVEYYGIPLIAKGEVKGVLEIFHRTPLESDKDWLGFMEVLAGQTAIAIDNAILFENLQRSKAELEQRVTERTAQLNQSNAELEHANRAKDEFLANMSHELRTPLNSILGLSESLLEQTRESLSDRQQRSLQVIESSGRHLLELINDILDLSKIEAGKLDFYPEILGVAEISQASLAFVRSQALEKSINLTFEEDPTASKFYADPRRLKQILVNLLNNAVKFTPEGGQVTLQVRANEDEDLIQFSVIDSGVGIAPQDLERLFQPFEQVDSSLNRKQEGTGLGLALVEKLTDLHGGSVQVESEVGKGSRFTINLPWRRESVVQQEISVAGGELPAPEQAEKSSVSSEQMLEHGRILLAEDNMANILTIGEYLESHGYQVTVAHDGVEALEKAEEINPGIILMDIQMPAMNGLEAIRRLRETPRFVSTPIIALTALAMPGDRERCLKAGASEYMSKPVSLRKLLHTINELLGRKE
jgi:PAS domain S-box-containing protein